MQFNYVDYENASVDSRRCLDVCRKHVKSTMVMELVKGGRLVNLPSGADAILRALNGGSNVSYAICYSVSLNGIIMVFSGMGNRT